MQLLLLDLDSRLTHESTACFHEMHLPLVFAIETRCSRTRARVGELRFRDTRPQARSGQWLPDAVQTPAFMPVGTAASLKGLLPDQVHATGCRLMLCNTYHLAVRPGVDTVRLAGGVHNFMRWPHALLTDSGGFQMVSLSKLMQVTEEGTTFSSPYSADPNDVLSLSPEESIRVQQALGSNIMMQLDDVLPATLQDEKRFREAAQRSVRWLDRCIQANKSRQHLQSLFPIVQGGLDPDMRRENLRQVVERETTGYAIGGLSGGEEKTKFVEIVSVCTEHLPQNKPRYLMGVGFPVDLLLCSAMGCDMFDCVYPSRTARFGTALVGLGQLLSVRKTDYATDPSVLDPDCDCPTCSSQYSRAYLHHLFRSGETLACHLLTVHNIRFQMRFMALIKQSIREDNFVAFMRKTLDSHYTSPEKYPDFVNKCLSILNIRFD